MIEIWKSIIGYEESYEISNFGRIRSIDRTIICKNGNPQFNKGKVLSPSKDKDGYLQIHLSKKGKLKYFRIHQLVFQTFTGQSIKYLDHKNRIKNDNCLTNLRPSTNSTNQANRLEPKNNTSGHKGIFHCKKTNKWRASIQKEDKRYWLGQFLIKENAIIAYNKKAKELFGEYSIQS